MKTTLDVPEEILGTFQRMRRQLPLALRDDEQTLRKLLAYAKLGGDRLVRHYLATLKSEFPEDTLLFKPRLPEEVPVEVVETADEEDGAPNDQIDA